MYSVFLVEDEIVIREGIKNMIAWEEYGYTFAGEAQDGELAWPMIKKCRPDIVITDIKMPFVDGLSLSKMIRNELPDTTVIILSGYDDFNYAREAVNIGVSRYLLKPLTKEQLIQALQEIKKSKDETLQQHKYQKQFYEEVQTYMSSSRRDFFDMLVSGNTQLGVILERAQKLDINLTAEQYNMVLFLLEENLMQDKYSSKLATVQEVIDSHFAQDESVVMFKAGMDLTVFLIKSDADNCIQDTQRCVEALKEICKPLGEEIQRIIITGEPVERLSSLPDCYRGARKELFSPAKETNMKAALSAELSDLDTESLDFKNLNQNILEKFLQNGLEQDVENFVNDYFAGFGDQAMRSMMFRNYVVMNLTFLVKSFLEGLYKTRDAIMPQFTKDRLEDAIFTYQGAQEFVSEVLVEAIRLRENAMGNKYSKMMEKAVSYMEEHYSDTEIGLNSVAKIANVSPTHFSTVFSQQMGKTFVEYLTSLRMEKARELLRCSSMSSSEIAQQVGYNDPHYFSFLFKKVNNCTPRDYRAGRK